MAQLRKRIGELQNELEKLTAIPDDWLDIIEENKIGMFGILPVEMIALMLCHIDDLPSIQR